MTTVVWFRRDLRLADNPALVAAAAAGDVVALFVDDPVFDVAGAARRTYLHRSLASLNDSMDGALVVRRGAPFEVVAAVAEEAGAGLVVAAEDFAPYGRRRDADVAQRLRADGRELRHIGSAYAVAPGSIEKGTGGAYAVFTPFSKAWLAHGWQQPVAVPEVRWRRLPTEALPAEPPCSADLPAVGESAAHRRWEEFLGGALDRYDEDRNLPGVSGTSQLSADLRWGVLHPRQLLADLRPCHAHDVFRSELAWREFYADVLFHHPDSARRNLQPKMDAMPLDTDAAAQERFRSWCAGRTGYPIVDAGMRQLAATGWMHNRVRMIVASFLVKDLHLPWWWGARHFMVHLVDGDLASNSHGWQWTAGTGTDAAPYFRIFNPVLQSERFDPDGTYIARWVPELAGLDAKTMHAPWLAKRGLPLGALPPMVDHGTERDEALRRYGAVTGS